MGTNKSKYVCFTPNAMVQTFVLRSRCSVLSRGSFLGSSHMNYNNIHESLGKGFDDFLLFFWKSKGLLIYIQPDEEVCVGDQFYELQVAQKIIINYWRLCRMAGEWYQAGDLHITRKLSNTMSNFCKILVMSIKYQEQ